MRLRPLTDPEEITLRARDVVIGGVLAIGTAIACVSYFTLSPGTQHRTFLISVCIAWAIVELRHVRAPRAAGSPPRAGASRSSWPGACS